ncbi:MAG TPA: gluconate 2-dehydrogenase subunit 3 family protein, partial [Candidatus Elarobacter sp.]|nr:gluconate 2-dehydrogenase subunit 3 family protein [Candidatus Elarobacter sp.]
MSDDSNNPRGISRRDALKLLGIAPLTGALHWTPADVDRAIRAVQSEQSEQAAPDTKPKFFTAHEYATVKVLVDIIIPRDERSGSATDAGVPAFMDYMLAQASERTRVEMHGGLAWLDTECRTRFGKTFLQSADTQRSAVLDDIAWPKKARPELSHGVAFFNSFRDLTAAGFFSSEMGHRDVKYQGNVFNPNWNGCPDEALRQL